MKAPTRTHLLVGLSILLASSVALAAGKKFVAKHKGQFHVSTESFDDMDDDAAMSAQVKAKSKTELAPTGGNEDGVSWDFHWIAVLSKKPGSANATIFFYDISGKERKQSTYKDIQIDANEVVVISSLSISEDDGLTAGKKYEIVLAVEQGGKQVPLAKGKVNFKKK